MARAGGANFRAIPPSIELVSALAWYWYLRGRLGEARRSIAAALAVPRQDPAERATASVRLVGMTATDAKGTNLTTASEEALTLVGDDGWALWFLTMTQLGVRRSDRTDGPHQTRRSSSSPGRAGD